MITGFVECTRTCELGKGINSLNGTELPSALKRPRSATAAPGAIPTTKRELTTECDITLATCTDELFDSLKVSSESEVGYGVASASTRVDFARSHKSKAFSSWLVIRVTVGSYEEFSANLELSREASERLHGANGPRAFFRAYGDRFVRGIESRSEFVAVLQIESSSQQDKEQLKVKWEAQGSVGKLSASTSGSVEKLLKTEHARSYTKFNYNSFGWKAEESPKLSGEDTKSVIDFALELQKTRPTGEPFRAFVEDYGASVVPSSTKLSFHALDDARHLLEKINDYRKVLWRRKAVADEVVANVLFYGYGNVHENRQKYTKISEEISRSLEYLEKIAGTCLSSFSDESDPVVPEIPAPPKYATESVEPPKKSLRPPWKVRAYVQIVSPHYRLTLAAHEDNRVYAAQNNPQDEAQRWSLLYVRERERDHPECCMIVVEHGGVLRALRAPSVENNYPSLVEFGEYLDDDSLMWRIPPVQNQNAIVTVRDGGRCLTLEGHDDWDAGKSLLYQPWHDGGNQHWEIRDIPE